VKPDDELCLCFHVTRRKVENYIRIERPRRAAQLSDCHGAGTGCGWCRKFLETLFHESQSADDPLPQASVEPNLPSAEEYSQRRTTYVQKGGGTPPPGATPVG